jgi:hypothetical protein
MKSAPNGGRGDVSNVDTCAANPKGKGHYHVRGCCSAQTVGIEEGWLAENIGKKQAAFSPNFLSKLWLNANSIEEPTLPGNNECGRVLDEYGGAAQVDDHHRTGQV